LNSSSNLGTISCYPKCVQVLKFATRNVIQEFGCRDIQVQVFSGSVFGFSFYAWS
jgi:hypothetical protein